jgi:dihydroorotase
MANSWRIRGGRVLDPATGRDEVADVWVVGGHIAAPPDRPPAGCRSFDARGRTIVPGLWDIHVHLREPGNPAAETLVTGARAAARGGFTTVLAMPNTQPPLDTPARVADHVARADPLDACRILTAGAVTVGRAGRELADLEGMAAEGAIAFTDDGAAVSTPELLREALRRAKSLNLPVLDHALDPSARGVMHEGARSRSLGLAGIPSEAEIAVVRRDIAAAAGTGAPVHLQHLSTAEAAILVREARARGLPVTAEVTPHHLALTDEDVRADDPNFKMSPPLRSARDRDALRAAIAAGDVQAFATDHAPHRKEAGQSFASAAFGVIGLETAVGVTYTVMVRSGLMSPMEWIRRWTVGPAAVLGVPPPSLAVGSPANLAILDLDTPWTVRGEAFASKSRNTPFGEWTLWGRAILTLRLGCEAFSDA